MKSLTRFKNVRDGQVFYKAGGIARSFIKTSDTEASASLPVQGLRDYEVLKFHPNDYVFVDSDYNVCDDAFLESAIRDSSLRFDFSRALYLLKSRDCIVTRQGWELMGQPAVFLSPGRAEFPEGSEPPMEVTSIPSYLYRSGSDVDANTTTIPALNFKFRDGRIDLGWTPTTIDMMAEDWYVPHLPRKGYAIHPLLPSGL